MKNDVSTVIDRTALIENIISGIILKYTAPRDEAFNFFWDILLDSSVMPLGSKLKAVMVISQSLNIKLKSNSLHNVLSYRNAFAHHELSSHQVVLVGKTPKDDKVHCELQVIKSSGKLERVPREVALEKFNKHYAIAKKSLIELRSAVENELSKTSF